jgi:hypothetical protein
VYGVNEKYHSLLMIKPTRRLLYMLYRINRIADITAYITRQPVCWGTHGYGFKAASDVLPMLRKPIPWLMEQYALTHLLLDERYASADTLGVSQNSLLNRCGDYAVYTLNKDCFLAQSKAATKEKG